ncbi:hypothetical protein [Pseudomonas kulmbachensis]|nr:hypothetical protein [Pseudomonas sp. FLM 004-28]
MDKFTAGTVFSEEFIIAATFIYTSENLPNLTVPPHDCLMPGHT